MWSITPRSDGQCTRADGGNFLTARVVTVQSMDGRCLTGRPGTGGITVAPCAPGNKNAAQLWWLNRNSRTVTALVSNASSSDPSAPIALEVNASDWRSVSLERLTIPTSNSGVPDAVNFTATQDWYWDERHEGRIIGGAFANSITFNQLNCDPQHTGHPTPSCIERMRSYAPYHECLSVAKDGPLQVWGGPLSGGDFAVLLLNRGPLNGTAHPITAFWAALGLPASARMILGSWARRLNHNSTSVCGQRR